MMPAQCEVPRRQQGGSFGPVLLQALSLVGTCAFAPDGRHLAAANEKGLVYILRLPK
jgi:hypothetical protein